MMNYNNEYVKVTILLFVMLATLMVGMTGMATAETIKFPDEQPANQTPDLEAVQITHDSGNIDIKLNTTNPASGDLLSNNLLDLYIDTGGSNGLSSRPLDLFNPLNINADYRIVLGDGQNSIFEYDGVTYTPLNSITTQINSSEVTASFETDSINQTDKIDFQAVYITDGNAGNYTWANGIGTVSLTPDSYDITIKAEDSNANPLNTSYSVLDSNNNKLATGFFGSDGSVTESLSAGSYTVQTGQSDADYVAKSSSITLNSAQTESLTLSKAQSDLTINIQDENGNALQTDFRVEDSDGNNVTSGDGVSSATVTLNPDNYDIYAGEGNSSLVNALESVNVDSDKSVTVTVFESDNGDDNNSDDNDENNDESGGGGFFDSGGNIGAILIVVGVLMLVGASAGGSGRNRRY